MTKVVVLGSGLVGSVLAADLAATRGFRVAVADRDEAALEVARRRAGRRIATLVADCGDPRVVRRLATDADLVVGALPSHLGHAAVKATIEAGRPCCDISFMPEDPADLDALARRKGVPVVVDCGVAPGLTHMLSALGVRRLDRAERIDIVVGGLPRRRTWPFEYKAGFSPFDVIEEYVRPARLVEHGRVVVREALSEPELLEFPGVGTLEAFNTDGLRSLLRTIDVPHMRERTLRYPGHIELMRVLRETGLFGLDPVEVGKHRIRPRDLLARLLFPKWTFEEGEEDLTAMRVVVEGTLAGRATRLEWTLLDRHDRDSGFSSMSRTTAFPAAAVARMIGTGLLSAPGVHEPERLASMEGVVESVLRQIADRGVRPRLRVLVEDRAAAPRTRATARRSRTTTRRRSR
ncbi:MAG: saccharopine dehydrogenase [Phycisphaerae bacterium]|nr:saccharopine dehydrogenase [Phycisphaerae bacterium]